MNRICIGRSHWFYCSLLALLVLIFYYRVLFEGQIFVFVDASRFFYPLWKWGADSLHLGLIPLWNPDAQFGTPYLADPQMAYAYPPVPLLYLLLNPVNAFASLVILHHLWALWGFWVFAKAEGYSGRIALLGSLIFGFSLHVVCSSWTPIALLTISWIPWVFWAAEKVHRGGKGGFLFLSFAWAMQLAAGYPVLTYLTVLALGLHFGWKTFWTGYQSQRENTKTPRKPANDKNFGWLLGFTAAGSAAVVYNLVWGLPFLEMFQRSNYENGASRYHDLNWKDLGTLFSPFDQGHPLLPFYHGPHYWVSTYFVGLPTLCLLIWGAVQGVYRKTSWPILPVLSLLSLGVLGLGHLLKTFLPGYSLVIHSGFWLAPLIFWIAWLSMESMVFFLQEKSSLEKKILWGGLAGLVYFLSYLVEPSLFPLSFWFSLGLLMASGWIKDPRGRYGLLLLALTLSLGTAAMSLNILMDRSYYQKPPGAAVLTSKPGRIFFTPPFMARAVRLQGESMESAYEGAKGSFYPNWPLSFGREEAPLYNTLQLRDPFAWTFKAFQYSLKHSRGVLDYLGIRYVLGKNLFGDFKVLQGSGSGVEISENPRPFTKWFSVEKALPAGPSLEDDFLKASKDKMDYGKECFVDDPAKAGNYQVRQVASCVQSPDRLTLTTQGSGKALVVSSETGDPGWKVYAGGKRKDTELINHAFRGVVLEEGEAEAVFNFEPMTFRLGLFFSFMICGLWAGLFVKRLKS